MVYCRIVVFRYEHGCFPGYNPLVLNTPWLHEYKTSTHLAFD
jgi:hypothetical protein